MSARPLFVRPVLTIVLTCVLSVSLGTVAASSATSAESSDVVNARQHFKAGEKAFNAGEYNHALMEFEAGYLLVPRPGFLLNMAHTERRLDHVARARELYQRYLDAEPQSSQRGEVLALMADLDRSLAAGGAGDAAAPAPPPLGAGKPTAVPAAPAPAPPVAAPMAETPPSVPVAIEPLPQVPPPAEEPGSLIATRHRNESSAESSGRQPVYKRWWFWAAMGAVAVGATTGIILGTRSSGPGFQNDGSLGRVGAP